MESRVLAHLTQAGCPVPAPQLNVSLGKHAATAAGSLARTGRIQGRQFRVPGRSSLVSQYLALGQTWPPLPVAAYEVKYAGPERRRSGMSQTAAQQVAAHA
jgi:hypothetical protein